MNCPVCGRPMHYNKFFNSYICERCGYEYDEKEEPERLSRTGWDDE